MDQHSFNCFVELPGERLDVYLSRSLRLSRSFIQKQLEMGRILLDDRPVSRGSYRLRVGQRLRGSFELEPSFELIPSELPIEVLYEDDSLLILNKAPGIVVHPSAGNQQDTLVHRVLNHLRSDHTFTTLSPTRPGVVHRLDKGTSGVIVFAKTRATQQNLCQQFKDRTVEKEYECLVWGETPLCGKINTAIGRHRTNRLKMSSSTRKGRTAYTAWIRHEALKGMSLLKVFPKSGRTHQIRVHLSENGFPIVGDTLYGQNTPQKLATVSKSVLESLTHSPYPFLHARRLKLIHPVNKNSVEITAPRPSLFEALISQLRSDYSG